MKYGIIGQGKEHYKRHFGLLHNDGNGNIKLNLMNKTCSYKIQGRNKKLFQELLNLLNNYYDLEDLNIKKKTGIIHIKQYPKIKKGEKEVAKCQKKKR